MAALVKSEFMSCCTRMRQQIAMDNEVSATFECCVQYQLWNKSGGGEAALVSAANEDVRFSPSPLCQACCMETNHMFRSWYDNSTVEARRCEVGCKTWPNFGLGVKCSCLNYVGGCNVDGAAGCVPSGLWRYAEGYEEIDMFQQCSAEVCKFRLLEDKVRNSRHSWMVGTLRDGVFTNSTLRHQVADALTQLDTDLAFVFTFPLTKTTDALLLAVYASASSALFLPETVFRLDGHVQACRRPDDICLSTWCYECSQWRDGSFSCPPQPCDRPPRLVQVGGVIFDAGTDLRADAKIRDVMVTKFDMLVFALKLAGYHMDPIEEMKMREEARDEWERAIPPFRPKTASPAIPVFSPQESSLPITSSLDHLEDRQSLRYKLSQGFAGDAPGGRGADAGGPQVRRRRPLCRAGSLHRPEEEDYEREEWKKQLDVWTGSGLAPNG
eukprot:763623-Hanusia_phi.AAC.2